MKADAEGSAKTKRPENGKRISSSEVKTITLGYYSNLEDAIKARERAEEKYYEPLLKEVEN